MAMIVATIDTETDEVVVTINGTGVPNVSDFGISTYMDYDQEKHTYVSICTMAKDQEAGLMTRTYISKAGVSAESPRDVTLVEKVSADIKNCFLSSKGIKGSKP